MKTSNIFREITSLTSENCFVIINRTKTNFNFPIHVHPEFELNFIENAQGAFRIVGDTIKEIEDVELCLIGNDKLEHGWVNGNCTSTNIHEITIQFHPDLFLDGFLSKKQFHSLSVMFENARKGIVFSRPAIDKLRNRIHGLVTNQNEFYNFIDLITILYELSIDQNSFVLSNCSFTNDNNNSESRRVQKVIEYIDANFQKEVHLAEVAEHVGMSKISLSRFIKKRTGKNYVDYVNDLRLSTASRYLVNTNKTIAEITFESGYNNLSNFNRIFKKRKGYTPGEFRKNYAKMRKLV